MSKSKSLSESAAEILAASLGAAAKEPMQGNNAEVTDLGGQTPQTLPDAIGAKAAAAAVEAPKPGQAGAPAETPKSLGEKPKKVEDEEEDAEKEAEMAKEETEVDGEQELTEAEVEEYLNSLSEEELESLVKEIEQLDEAEKANTDTAKKEEEEVALTEEQIAEARKTAMKKLVADNMGSCKEDIDALFSGESLSEEFKNKAVTIFEAAVRSRVEEITAKVVAENEASLQATVSEIESNLTNQVDEYLNYVVESWLEENKLAVDSGLRAEIAEEFIVGLKNLFLEHYIEVPEDKADLVETLAAKVAETEKKLEEQAQANAELTKKLNESVAQELLRKACEGLTEVQVAKIKSLAEGVEFTTEGEYSQKLAVIRENYFPSKKVKSESPQQVVETGDGSKEVSPIMNRYVEAISKQLPR